MLIPCDVKWIRHKYESNLHVPLHEDVSFEDSQFCKTVVPPGTEPGDGMWCPCGEQVYGFTYPRWATELADMMLQWADESEYD